MSWGVECTDNLIYNENATGSVFDGGRIMRKAVTLLNMLQIISNPVKASSYWGRMSRIGSSHLPLTGRKVVMFLLTTPEAQLTFPSTKTLGLLQPK